MCPRHRQPTALKNTSVTPLGNVPIVYKMRFDANVTAVVRPPRRIPFAMEGRVKRELDRMVKIGAITPMSAPTQWLSQMVAAKKKDDGILHLH